MALGVVGFWDPAVEREEVLRLAEQAAKATVLAWSCPPTSCIGCLLTGVWPCARYGCRWMPPANRWFGVPSSYSPWYEEPQRARAANLDTAWAPNLKVIADFGAATGLRSV